MTGECPANTDRAWSPALPLFVVSESDASCYWCKRTIAVGSPAALYPAEQKGAQGFSLGALRFRFLPAIAHEQCHREACA